MAINVKEITEVFHVKDLQFSSYEEGEDLLHEASYGLYMSYESAQAACKMLEEKYPNLPRGGWHVYAEPVYIAN